jgi:type IV pilus biogenesis protein PilP
LRRHQNPKVSDEVEEMIQPDDPGIFHDVSPTQNAKPKTNAKLQAAEQEPEISTYIDPALKQDADDVQREVFRNGLLSRKLNSDLEVKKAKNEMLRLEAEDKEIRDKMNETKDSRGNPVKNKETPVKQGTEVQPPRITVDSIYGVDDNLQTTLSISGYGRVVLNVGQPVPLTRYKIHSISRSGVILTDDNKALYSIPFSS